MGRLAALAWTAGLALALAGASCGGEEAATCFQNGSPADWVEAVEPAGIPSPIVVPDVAGDDLLTAFARLRVRGLRVAIPEPFRFSEAYVPRADVQRPEPDTRVPAGSTVELRNLWAPQGLLVAPAPEVTVPDVVGLTAREAIRRLEDACALWGGTFPALPASDAPHLFEAYVVVQEKPAAGERLLQEARVGSGTRIQGVGLNARPRPSGS